jgi:hypothetical protein
MGPRVATCQSRNDWIQASTSGMSIRPGWVDPNAASSLEYLHRGNTALAGLQYSYLPSWISFLVDKDEAAEAGIALYRHVHRRWGPAPGRGPPQAGHLRREPGPLRRRGGRGSTARRRWPTWSPGRTGRCSPAPPPPTTSGTSSPTTASPAPRSGARSTPAAPASSSPTGPPTWNGPTRPGGTLACCTCTIPRTRWGTPPSRPSGTARNGPTGPRATTSPPGSAGTRSSPASRRSPTSSPASAAPPDRVAPRWPDRDGTVASPHGPTGAVRVRSVQE